jgi:hypothetical protein
VKKSLYRTRASFEPRRASPFRKKIKALRVLREAARAWTIIPFFLLPVKVLVVLAGSNCGDQHAAIVLLCRPPPRQDLGRAKMAGTRFARDDKEPRPQLGAKIYLENGPFIPPRRGARTLSPARTFRRKAPLRLVVQRSRPQAPLAPMRGAPAYFFFCKWGV